MFDKAENFCKGEYEGDTTALTTAMEDETATASVTLDAENGATLAKKCGEGISENSYRRHSFLSGRRNRDLHEHRAQYGR